MTGGDEDGRASARDELTGFLHFDVVEDEQAAFGGEADVQLADVVGRVAVQLDAEKAGEVGGNGSEVATNAGEPIDRFEIGLI